jgi:potassium voltage-gated channel Eag-related subfamily H protein 8
MERMINARLIWFLESNGLLSNIQYGFRQSKSLLDHLVRFETFIRNAFAKKEHAVSIFFDLEKAYDTTWKYGILKDLFSRNHIRRALIILSMVLHTQLVSAIGR